MHLSPGMNDLFQGTISPSGQADKIHEYMQVSSLLGRKHGNFAF